ncbi:MAG TPA: sulfatase-like hydrolase/transferase [Bryobacteraceae bacterium]|nr:sulfatase-like hydrolase/transferase [Bryobacteraceae bacterium]
MTRKDFLLLAPAAAGIARPPSAFAQAPARPPNVLLLMSDQHRPRALSIDGHPVARTPRLDELAHSGVRFDSAYCSNPVCVPSRASLLTGLYTHHHRAYNNTTPWPFEKKTMAHYFGRAGYMTALIGKMHFVDAQTHGFDYRLDFNDWYQYLGPRTRLYADELGFPNSGSGLPQIDDLWRDFGDPWKGTRESDGRQGPVAVGRVSRIPERDQFESFVARESVRFLRTHGRRQPFLLVCSFLKPHDPFMPSARFAAMFRAEDMRLPDTWGRVDLSRVPREIRESIEHNRPTPELRDPLAARRRIALYYASLAQMDENAGLVLDALRELDLDRNTVVLYTSDHGEMLGEHGLWQKFVFYEPSVGVPLIVRAPGVAPPGARSATPVSLVQVLPTLAELCGLPAPAGLDGESLVPDLRQPGLRRQTTVYAEYNLQTPRAKYMIRRGDFKYCHYTSDTPELYNLSEDPQEMRNLAGLSAYQPREEELKADLLHWIAQ